MKILFVDSSISALGNLGGDGRSLVQLIRGLTTQGVEVAVCGICPSTRLDSYAQAGARTFSRLLDPEAMARYRRMRSAKAGGALTKALLSRRLVRAVRQFRSDVVHVNLFQKWDGFDLRVARLLGLRTVAHLRSLGSQVTLGRFDVEACDAIVAVSDVVGNFVRAAFPGAKVQRIYDPVDANLYRSNLDRRQARSRFGLQAHEPPLLVSVAALEPRKGHDLAIRCLAEIRRTGIPALLAVAGAAYDVGDTSEHDRLMRLAHELGVSDQVYFLGNVERMADLYAAADVVFALSHDGEALGRVPIEASFAGRPVVATAAGATPEIVEDGRTGMLVSPGDVGNAVARTLHLLQNPRFASALAQAAAERASVMFSVQRSGSEMLALYQSVLGRSA